MFKPRTLIALGMTTALMVSATAFLSCATAGPIQAVETPALSADVPEQHTEGDGVSLFDAIEQAAETLAGELPARARVAVVAFESENDGLSGFIMAELNSALFRRGLQVASRQNLEAVFMELDFHLTGYVSDETAVSIGKMLGAEYVITGQLWDIGLLHRLAVDAINVETAISVSAPRVEVRNDDAMRSMVEAMGRR